MVSTGRPLKIAIRSKDGQQAPLVLACVKGVEGAPELHADEAFTRLPLRPWWRVVWKWSDTLEPLPILNRSFDINVAVAIKGYGFPPPLRFLFVAARRFLQDKYLLSEL
jgi:hypothetical protein